MKYVFAALWFSGVCTTACNDDFSEGWRVDKTRVLGARAMVDSDPTRASPAPGESFHVDWFVVSPGGARPISWQFSACRQADALRGVECDGPGLSEVAGTSQVPSIALTAPSSDQLGDATNLLVWGDIDNTNVDYSVMLQTPKTGTNRNPHIDSADIRLGGNPLTAENGACETLPRLIADDSVLDLSLTVRDRDREPLGAGRETMQLSHFTTAGKLDRLYSVVDGSAPAGDAVLSVPWTARRDVSPPQAGLIVRFYFGLRDSRGGMDFATRAICLRPQG